MPRLTLERAGKVLDLDALLTGVEGMQAVAGITGFGLPPVTVQWSEGVGNGARMRGRRVTARPIDLPLTIQTRSREVLQGAVRDLSFVLDGEATLRLTEDPFSPLVGVITPNSPAATASPIFGGYQFSFASALAAGDPWLGYYEVPVKAGETYSIAGTAELTSGASGDFWTHLIAHPDSWASPLHSANEGRVTLVAGAGPRQIPAVTMTIPQGMNSLQVGPRYASSNGGVIRYVPTISKVGSPVSRTVSVVRTGGGDFALGTDTDGRYFAKTVVTLQAGDPFWTSSVPTSSVYTGSGIPAVMTITNPGTTDAYPVWTISGPGLNFKVTSPFGEVLNFADFIPQGTTITIDAKTGTVTDQNGTSRYTGLGSAPRFFAIPPGTMSLTVSYDRSSAQFTAATSGGRKNYVTNPIFATGSTGWTLASGWAWASAAQNLAHSSFSTGAQATTGGPQELVKVSIPVTGLTAGQTYQVRASVTSTFDPASTVTPVDPSWPTLTNRVDYKMTIGVKADAGATTSFIASQAVDYGATEVSLTFTAPSSTVYLTAYPATSQWRRAGQMQVSYQKSHPATLDNAFVGEPGVFFSGATPASGAQTYSWAGAANNSVSKETTAPDLTKSAVGYSFNARDWMVI